MELLHQVAGTVRIGPKPLGDNGCSDSLSAKSTYISKCSPALSLPRIT